MKPDNRLPILIFLVLVVLLAAPLGYQKFRDSRRPKLVQVRVVTASDRDPVFRTGARHLDADEEFRLAVALELKYAGDRRQWMAPADRLEIDGNQVDHLQADQWPEKDRSVRVFWFTVEGANVGGVVDPGNAAKRLRYSNFLAPELGRGLLATMPPEVHNDDPMGDLITGLPVAAGTLRFYVRVEVIEPEQSEVTAVQWATSRGPRQISEPGYPAVHRAINAPPGVDPSVGELFNLSGWEVDPDDSESWTRVAQIAYGTSLAGLVDARVFTTSRTFAAVAATGTPSFSESDLQSLGEIVVTDGAALIEGRPVAWDSHIRPGDCLVEGHHFTVLVEDDGNGLLDTNDTVIHCWKRPPAKLNFGTVFADGSVRLEILRHGG